MATGDMHVGDIGAVIEYIVTEDGEPLDISGATVKQLKLRAKDGTTKTKTAAFITTGTDGGLKYVTTVVGDLDVKGLWYVQAYLELPGWKGHADLVEFDVAPVL